MLDLRAQHDFMHMQEFVMACTMSFVPWPPLLFDLGCMRRKGTGDDPCIEAAIGARCASAPACRRAVRSRSASKRRYCSGRSSSSAAHAIALAAAGCVQVGAATAV